MPWSNQPIVSALVVVISGGGGHAGLFVYNGTPAKGNLVAAITAPGVTSDPFGNNVPSSGVFNAGTWNASGTLTSHFGINNSGDTFLANTAGLTVVHERSSDGSEFFYNTSGEGAGNLITSIAPAATTDGPGNTVFAGFASYSAFMNLQITAGGLSFHRIAPDFALPPKISASGSNTTGAIVTLDSGNATGATDSQLVLYDSKAFTGLTHRVLQAITDQVVVQTANATPFTSALVEVDGGMAAVSLTAIVSSVAETWHNATLNAANYTNAGFGAATSFQIEPINGGRVRLRGSVNLASNQAAGSTVFTLPAGYVPVANQFFTTVNSLSGFAASTGSIKVTSAGAVTINCAGVTGNFVMFDGVVIELD